MNRDLNVFLAVSQSEPMDALSMFATVSAIHPLVSLIKDPDFLERDERLFYGRCSHDPCVMERDLYMYKDILT